MKLPLALLLVSSYYAYHEQWRGYELLSLSMTTISNGSESSSFYYASAYSTLTLRTLGKQQLSVLDGAEWDSVQRVLMDQQRQDSLTKYGYMNVVTGTDEDDRRIVAMQCMDGNSDNSFNHYQRDVYEDSIAVIPKIVSDEDAIATYVSSLSCIHCAIRRIENIDGSEDSILSTRKAVVLGSSDLACFSAEGLASLGMEVFMVNGKGNANVRKNIGNLNIIKPAVGDSETAFSSHLGQFDFLVDTIGNERFSLNDDDNDVDGISLGESTLKLLKSRHNCCTYISTLTNSQSLVANEGILFGPSKVDKYCEQVGSISFLTTSRECRTIPPPESFGKTIDILMNKGIIFTEKQRRKACSKKSDAIRGWNLSDFLEQSLWPRDSSGSGRTRFGLPVRDDPDDDDDDRTSTFENQLVVSVAPYQPEEGNKRIERSDDDEVGEYNYSFSSKSSSRSSNPKNRAIQKNPYVLNIMDIEGIENEIISTEKSCVVFMSAKFCKTCKSLDQAFTRMARIDQENDDDKSNKICFVKAETSGERGKELAKYVSVRAVPAFVFIRSGKILGQEFVSKLPSPKIDRAIKLLKNGAEWKY